MSLTFRTPGPWGPGTGTPLTHTQVDTNFHELHLLIQAASSPETRGIDSITTNGSQMTIYLTDGSTQGPFTLPRATMEWKGTFTPTMGYSINDVFTEPLTNSVYLVLVPHSGAATFDPNREIGGTQVYRKMIQGVNADTAVVTRTGLGDFTLDAASMRKYYRIAEATAIEITIPDDAVVNFPINTQIEFYQAGPGTVTISAPWGLLNIAEDRAPTTKGQGAIMAIKKVGLNEWDCVGLLAEV